MSSPIISAQSIYYHVPVKNYLQFVCSWKKNVDILLYSLEHLRISSYSERKPFLLCDLAHPSPSNKLSHWKKMFFFKPGLGNLFLMSCILPILGYFSRNPKLQVFTVTDIWEQEVTDTALLIFFITPSAYKGKNHCWFLTLVWKCCA
jgi:hypothetical protein